LNNSTNRAGRGSGRYVPRFASEVFLHSELPSHAEGPVGRRLFSEVAWKQPPAAKINSEIST
jgi:hypothetical protein